jgi:hypothetical protein
MILPLGNSSASWHNECLEAAIVELDELGENDIAPEYFENGFSGERAVYNLESVYDEWTAAHRALWNAIEKEAA